MYLVSFALTGNLFDLKLRKNYQFHLNCYVKNDDPMFETKQQMKISFLSLSNWNWKLHFRSVSQPTVHDNKIMCNEQNDDDVDDDEFVMCHRWIHYHYVQNVWIYNFFSIVPPETRESHWKYSYHFETMILNVFVCSRIWSHHFSPLRIPLAI